MKKNKKGSTFEGWTEGIVFTTLFVILFVGIIASMNTQHNQDFEVEGLSTDAIQESLETYQQSQQEKLNTGDASFTSAVGLTVSTSWDVLTSVMGMIMFFLTGGWLQSIASYLHLPAIVGMMLQTIFVIALGFILLRVLFKERI